MLQEDELGISRAQPQSSRGRRPRELALSEVEGPSGAKAPQFIAGLAPEPPRRGRLGLRGSGPSHAALPIGTGCEQCAHRRASMGISLRHSGHFLVVGSAGTGSFRMRATRAFTGVTTKK